ncbi:DNA topoisomerase 2-binding protein 1-A isoform X2 [Ananas comosus]|uniref:DNA topoisomerase 2-binding protein 1-A isoform X2 n=1 Tax=Ananas comosus TaxID=4615 RepID=A0A6P5GGT1_ANACO|nr:DNA topoisomerase 2-binding protein 1-A isoform X2 [Ananas comosus]
MAAAAAAAAARTGTFDGANVFLSRSLVPPEVFDALHDALKLNGARVFLCCDPSRNSPSDYHVISSPDHEKFADLRAKGCNLLGPQCILTCAKEHRVLPKEGYTCCLAMDGVKVLASGFEKDEKVKIEQLVTAMGGVLLTKASLDVNFVIAKNVLAAKYKWALNVLKKPIVNMSWLNQCWTEHRLVPQEPYRVLPFSGLTICVTRIPADERKELEKMILQNGGIYSADLTKKCTHLISNAAGGDKYTVARRWGHIHIANRRWVDQSIARRACLDERFYPINENSASCNDMKSTQKEQRYQENSNTNFQPAPSSLSEELEATLSQNISTSYSDASRINTQSVEAPTLQKMDEVNYNSRVAEDSETEDNDLYLSDCRIFLVGFGENELAKLVGMIRKGGGSRYMLLSEKLTHIIVGTPSEVEKKEVRRLASWGIINVVKATWLEECDQVKTEVTVSSRHIASELLLLKDTSCFSMDMPSDVRDTKRMKSSAGVSHVLQDKNFLVELSSEIKEGREKSQNEISSTSFVELLSKSEQSTQCQGMKTTDKGKSKAQAITGTMDASNSGSSNIFKGRKFCFSTSFPRDRRAQVLEWVSEGGGVTLDGQQRVNADFIIECHGLSSITNDISHSTVVSTHWIRSCLEDVGSHIIYSPLQCRIPLPGFEGLRFCVSQYEEKERLLLKNLCFTLGAKFTEKLTKKVTHLLCKFMSGPKYEASCKWGIPSVTAEWITECVSQDMIVGLDHFRPKAVTVQDREAGLCTMTQYPTQAAQMVSGYCISELPSQPKVPTDSLKQNPGNPNDSLRKEPRYPSTSFKGPRLSGCDIINETSGKNKEAGKLLGSSNTVPDVADAIEDLLAQSTKIQDMKSPGRSGCERSIYAPDHSIVGQDRENSHSTFGISRKWLDRAQKQDTTPDTAGHNGNPSSYDAFSETQTESQVVGYEEDLSGRQKIIDRVRSQSFTLTPSNEMPSGG